MLLRSSQQLALCYLWMCSSVYALQFYNVTSQVHNEDIVELLEFFMVQYEGRNKLNGTVIARVQLNEMSGKFSLLIERNRGRMQRLLRFELDGCKFLESKYDYMKAPKLMLQTLFVSKSFHKKCPVPAHDIWKFEHFDFDTKILPDAMPNVSLAASVTVFFNSIKAYSVTLKGFTK